MAAAVISEGATRGKLYELAQTSVVDTAPVMGAAAEVRDRAFGPRITYSRKVFIPLTELCHDNCSYCTPTVRAWENGLTSRQGRCAGYRPGAGAGCKETLFTLGDKPEKRYQEARRELAEFGFASTVEYLAHVCRLVLEETGLLPHANPRGAWRGGAGLQRVAVSQIFMLEQTSDRLLGPTRPTGPPPQGWRNASKR